MNKTELVNVVAGQIEGATKKDIAVVIDTVFSAITSTLANGDSVKIAGFGGFEVVERAARTARNPQTGLAIEVPASKAVKFKPASALKATVKGE
jgi:DNA-binding protein HU-beta